MYNIFTFMASYPSGKGLVCKTTMHRFDSDRRLANSAVLSEPHFFCPAVL